jgi:hypothetical protein
MDDPKDQFNDRQLLYRIDERTNVLVTGFASFKEEIHRLTISLERKFVSHEEFQPVKEKYVSREEFQPIKLLVYGLVGLIMTSVFGSLLFLVLKNPPSH